MSGTSAAPATTGKPVHGKYLTFMISKERYGIDILAVQEIIGITSITTVPRCPDFIKGVINLRGRIIPVIDLRLKFGIEPIPYNDRTCIIVVHLHRDGQVVPAGVIVDTVLEVINFGPEDIEPPPNYGESIDTSFIVGMGKHDAGLNILIDIEKALSASEQIAAIQSVVG